VQSKGIHQPEQNLGIGRRQAMLSGAGLPGFPAGAFGIKSFPFGFPDCVPGFQPGSLSFQPDSFGFHAGSLVFQLVETIIRIIFFDYSSDQSVSKWGMHSVTPAVPRVYIIVNMVFYTLQNNNRWMRKGKIYSA
jgi:hypothetical protein